MEKLNAKETSSQEGATKPLYFMWWVAWGLIALCFMVFTVKYYLESSKLAGTGRVQSQTNWILRNIGEGGRLKEFLRRKRSVSDEKPSVKKQRRHVPPKIFQYYLMLLDHIEKGNAFKANRTDIEQKFIHSVEKYLNETKDTESRAVKLPTTLTRVTRDMKSKHTVTRTKHQKHKHTHAHARNSMRGHTTKQKSFTTKKHTKTKLYSTTQPSYLKTLAILEKEIYGRTFPHNTKKKNISPIAISDIFANAYATTSANLIPKTKGTYKKTSLPRSTYRHDRNTKFSKSQLQATENLPTSSKDIFPMWNKSLTRNFTMSKRYANTSLYSTPSTSTTNNSIRQYTTALSTLSINDTHKTGITQTWNTTQKIIKVQSTNITSKLNTKLNTNQSVNTTQDTSNTSVRTAEVPIIEQTIKLTQRPNVTQALNTTPAAQKENITSKLNTPQSVNTTPDVNTISNARTTEVLIIKQISSTQTLNVTQTLNTTQVSNTTQPNQFIKNATVFKGNVTDISSHGNVTDASHDKNTTDYYHGNATETLRLNQDNITEILDKSDVTNVSHFNTTEHQIKNVSDLSHIGNASIVTTAPRGNGTQEIQHYNSTFIESPINNTAKTRGLNTTFPQFNSTVKKVKNPVHVKVSLIPDNQNETEALFKKFTSNSTSMEKSVNNSNAVSTQKKQLINVTQDVSTNLNATQNITMNLSTTHKPNVTNNAPIYNITMSPFEPSALKTQNFTKRVNDTQRLNTTEIPRVTYTSSGSNIITNFTQIYNTTTQKLFANKTKLHNVTRPSVHLKVIVTPEETSNQITLNVTNAPRNVTAAKLWNATDKIMLNTTDGLSSVKNNTETPRIKNTNGELNKSKEIISIIEKFHNNITQLPQIKNSTQSLDKNSYNITTHVQNVTDVSRSVNQTVSAPTTAHNVLIAVETRNETTQTTEVLKTTPNVSNRTVVTATGINRTDTPSTTTKTAINNTKYVNTTLSHKKHKTSPVKIKIAVTEDRINITAKPNITDGSVHMTHSTTSRGTETSRILETNQRQKALNETLNTTQTINAINTTQESMLNTTAEINDLIDSITSGYLEKNESKTMVNSTSDFGDVGSSNSKGKQNFGDVGTSNNKSSQLNSFGDVGTSNNNTETRTAEAKLRTTVTSSIVDNNDLLLDLLTETLGVQNNTTATPETNIQRFTNKSHGKTNPASNAHKTRHYSNTPTNPHPTLKATLSSVAMIPLNSSLWQWTTDSSDFTDHEETRPGNAGMTPTRKPPIIQPQVTQTPITTLQTNQSKINTTQVFNASKKQTTEDNSNQTNEPKPAINLFATPTTILKTLKTTDRSGASKIYTTDSSTTFTNKSATKLHSIYSLPSDLEEFFDTVTTDANDATTTTESTTHKTAPIRTQPITMDALKNETDTHSIDFEAVKNTVTTKSAVATQRIAITTKKPKVKRQSEDTEYYTIPIERKTKVTKKVLTAFPQFNAITKQHNNETKSWGDLKNTIPINQMNSTVDATRTSTKSTTNQNIQTIYKQPVTTANTTMVSITDVRKSNDSVPLKNETDTHSTDFEAVKNTVMTKSAVAKQRIAITTKKPKVKRQSEDTEYYTTPIESFPAQTKSRTTKVTKKILTAFPQFNAITKQRKNKTKSWRDFMNRIPLNETNSTFYQNTLIKILTDNNKQEQTTDVRIGLIKYLKKIIKNLDHKTPVTQAEISTTTSPVYKLHWDCYKDATRWSTAYIIGMSRFLQSHNVKCRDHEFLQEFQLVDNKEQLFPLFRYEYICCKMSLKKPE